MKIIAELFVLETLCNDFLHFQKEVDRGGYHQQAEQGIE
jgi:hypothetical protein